VGLGFGIQSVSGLTCLFVCLVLAAALFTDLWTQCILVVDHLIPLCVRAVDSLDPPLC
jgi:hypothetical protein